MSRLLTIALGAFVFACSPSAMPLAGEDPDITVMVASGIAALTLGNYSGAIRIFQKLANQGNAEGEFTFGQIYEEEKA